MNEITFQRPEAFWLLTLLLVTVVVRRHLHRTSYAGIASASLLNAGLRASRVRGLPVAIAGLAFAAVVAALADPVFLRRERHVSSRGLDIAIVLDLSSSMEERMGTGAGPNQRTRLDVTKRAIREFINRRPQDRIGLVVFSDHSYVVSPLTSDHQYLHRYVGSIDERTLRSEGMTAIGEGITTAHQLLRRQARDSRQRHGVLVVFTDGEHNHGRDPVDAVTEAFDEGWRVHLIGVDLDDEVKQKPAVLRLVRTIESRGGHYFTAENDRELSGASAAIDGLEAGLLVSAIQERNAPAYGPLALTALLLVGTAALVGAVPFFIDLT